MESETRIQVATSQEHGTVVVRPSGRCTVGMCETLQYYMKETRNLGMKGLYVDLSGAEFIDSTFTGFLLSMAKRKQDAAAPAFHLLRPSEAATGVLRELGVLQIFDIRQSIPNPPTDWTELPIVSAGCERVADHVIDAHEELIDSDSTKSGQFVRVVELFKADRDRKRGSDSTH